jgi:sugar phosphate isomerase/epimerase
MPVIWNIALSTMWAIKKFDSLEDFFVAAQDLGFAGVELNHQVDSAMLAGIDLARYSIQSIHEPCPATPSVEILKARDWLISAIKEDNRMQGVEAIKRSIDFASSLGVRSLVVHAGNVRGERPLEKSLYGLFEKGKAGTPEYNKVRIEMEQDRARFAAPHLKAVRKSLVELLEYARPRGVQLGLENRYHFMDIPSQDELGMLLALGGPAQLGFWYDIGHAQALDRLGFFPHEEWLQRYANRMVGVHLHDVIGINDHDAPGMGEVDYTKIAGFLPADIIHTLEIRPGISADQIRGSLKYLAQKGCIQPV